MTNIEVQAGVSFYTNPPFQTVNASTNSVYVSFDLKLTSALDNSKIKIQVTVTVGTAKTVYDTDDISVGSMGNMLFRQFQIFIFYCI